VEARAKTNESRSGKGFRSGYDSDVRDDARALKGWMPACLGDHAQRHDVLHCGTILMICELAEISFARTWRLAPDAAIKFLSREKFV